MKGLEELYPGLEENPARRFSEVCYEWLECIAQSIVVVVVLLTFVFRIVNVSGDSMLNTLHNGDKLLVVQWGYRPKNGDVVIIRKGERLDEPLVKRVIATEGQTLSIDFASGSVTVDGKILNEKSYIREPMRVQGDADTPGVVPQGRCYVMGDNRNKSLDSRYSDVGLIKNEDVVGKAEVILYPFSRFGVIR